MIFWFSPSAWRKPFNPIDRKYLAQKSINEKIEGIPKSILILEGEINAWTWLWECKKTVFSASMVMVTACLKFLKALSPSWTEK